MTSSWPSSFAVSSDKLAAWGTAEELALPAEVLATDPCVRENKSAAGWGCVSTTELSGTEKPLKSNALHACYALASTYFVVHCKSCSRLSFTCESLWLTADQQGNTEGFTHVAYLHSRNSLCRLYMTFRQRGMAIASPEEVPVWCSRFIVT